VKLLLEGEKEEEALVEAKEFGKFEAEGAVGDEVREPVKQEDEHDDVPSKSRIVRESFSTGKKSVPAGGLGPEDAVIFVALGASSNS
jgi:hypothetical protein